MIFNTTYSLGKILQPMSQEEILNTPVFFAMSYQEIIAHPKCPEHLKKVLLGFDWCGRPNYVQVRIQDHRKGQPSVLGGAWHVDLNTPLANGRMHLAKNMDEFRSMTASFGGIRETEFAVGPLEIDTSKVDPFNHPQFAGHVESMKPEVVRALPGQLAIYTARDAHRVSPMFNTGRVRLMIVTVECDSFLEKSGGYVGPALIS